MPQKTCFFRNVFLLSLSLIVTCSFSLNAQILRDSLATGHLLDAAEEYWPKSTDTLPERDFSRDIKHLPINNSKGFISIGGSVREGFELFNNYLWGMDKRDNDGYLLHRLLLHGDFRLTQKIRFFTELENSLVIGRNGGPRPIQDENKFAVNQAFAEYSMKALGSSTIKLRLGKQALSYGIGSLLDVRDANVRLSFVGGKVIINHKNVRVDAFAMKAIKNNQGYFDDEVNKLQKIAGVWIAQPIQKGLLKKIDTYYIYIDREGSLFEKVKGREMRNTIGVNLWSSYENISGYTEADFQWGRFNDKSIIAWKIVQAFFYKMETVKFKPIVSVHFAVSSGDRNPYDSKIQTFNPIYPKAIYYGYIDNAGSANMIVVHEKLETTVTQRLKLTLGYYNFWRKSKNDGLYYANGTLLLPASNHERNLSEMFDLNLSFAVNTNLFFQLISAYARRSKFLKQQTFDTGDISYIGVRSNLFF